jgi:hypothetical protein
MSSSPEMCRLSSLFGSIAGGCGPDDEGPDASAKGCGATEDLYDELGAELDPKVLVGMNMGVLYKWEVRLAAEWGAGGLVDMGRCEVMSLV